jgi:hypothetical protein
VNGLNMANFASGHQTLVVRPPGMTLRNVRQFQ